MFLVGMLGLGLGWLLVRGPFAGSPPAKVARKTTSPPSPQPPKPVQQTQPAPATEKATRPVEKPSSPSVKPGLTFDRDVLPILEKKCLACHGELKRNGKLDMRTLAALKKGGSGGPGVVPGMPDSSPVWVEVAEGRMPPGGKNRLTPAEKDLLRNWIVSGAK